MPRIEIELTSSRDDGSWTWRAAGAREPRGTLDGSLLPTGAAVGDQLRAETEQFLDGLEITALLLPKAGSDQPDLLEILGSGRNEPQVITTLAKKGRSGRKGESPHSDDKPRGRRRDGKDGKGRRKERGERSQSTRSDGETGSSNKKKESSRRRSRKGATASPLHRHRRPTEAETPAAT